MAAIISGNSLGLTNSSLASLGGQGLLGTAQTGRAGENVFVDSTTGNLVLQHRDELLLGRGLDLGLVRTYNSQGLLNDDNADNWRMGVYKQVAGLTGTVNTAGSTVRRTDGDGAESVYTYNATLGVYVNTDGGGAFDTLSFNATAQTWTFTDGASQVKELYDNANGGRITQMQDTDGNSLTYTYNAAGLITQVTDASGETTFLDYTGTNLTQIRTVMGANTLTRVRYTYDASNRLSQVIVDLSPQDNSITDNNTYVTTYTYDGTSTRVATLAQSDGTSLTFAYVQVGTAFKVSSITDALGQVTSFSYTAGAGPSTTVNANPAVLTTPTPSWSGASLLETSATAASMPLIGADGAGNLIAVFRQGSDLIARRYNKASGVWSANTVLDNRTNAISAPQLYVDASGNAIATWGQSDGTATSTYVNRFVNGAWQGTELVEAATVTIAEPVATINAAGNAAVVWHQTNGTVEDLYANLFSGGVWSGAQSIEALATTVANPGVAIDAQGNVQAVWQQSDGTANSIYTNRYAVGPYYAVQAGDTWSSIAQVVYGTAAAASALQTASGNPALTTGLQLTVPASLTLSGGQATITDALGKATVLSFDAMGELTGVTAPAVGGVSQTTSYAYNANGDVTQVTDPRGNVVTYGYDASGNRILDRDAAGNTVTRTYGPKNQLLTETAYVVPDPDGAGAGQPGTLLTTRYVYDANNHLRFVVSAEGRVTEFRYNSFGLQVAAIRYSGNPYSLAGLNSTDALTEAQLTTFVGTADKTKTLRVDTSYDFRGQVASTTTYATVDAAGNGVANGTQSATQYVYDQAGNLLTKVDPRGVATTTQPGAFDHRRPRSRHRDAVRRRQPQGDADPGKRPSHHLDLRCFRQDGQRSADREQRCAGDHQLLLRCRRQAAPHSRSHRCHHAHPLRRCRKEDRQHRRERHPHRVPLQRG